MTLASIVSQDVPEIGLKSGTTAGTADDTTAGTEATPPAVPSQSAPPAQPSQSQTPPPPAKQGKGCQATPGPDQYLGLLPLAGVLLLLLVPMRRRTRGRA